MSFRLRRVYICDVCGKYEKPRGNFLHYILPRNWEKWCKRDVCSGCFGNLEDFERQKQTTKNLERLRNNLLAAEAKIKELETRIAERDADNGNT